MHAQHSGGHTRRDPLVVGLAEARALDVAEIGAKAANLARLAAVGFPVPAGLGVTLAAEERWEEALPHLLEAAGALGVGRFAVRSSGTSEDLEDASFAGQYETILGVPFDGLPEAVRSVFVSADASRVSAYQEAQGEASAGDRRPRMAVLVQAMVGADAAGVAFTANPLTGERGEVVITAVRELGERLVSGAAVGDEWVVRDGEAVCKRADEGAISAGQAANIAALARRVEEHFESPQDIEWAISASRLYLLQARPMTALPEPVDWTPPTPGYWMRNFRLGEWLPEAMTPLFADWLLELIEDGHLRGMRFTVGTAIPFRCAAINGWYYTTIAEVSPRLLGRALVESRGRMVPILWNALIRVNNDPVAADRAVLGSLADQWRNEILPRYCRMVATAQEWVGTATPAELVGIVDGVGTSAGEYLFSLAIVGGSAWKMEAALAKFVRRNFSDRLGFTPKVLLRGLPGMDTETPPHAVQSVDWYRPTLGELDGQGDLSDAVADRKRTWERQRRLAAPLALGAPPKTIRSLIHGAAESARSTPVPSDAVLVGEPASPGRATGRVRIVHGPEDFRSFRDGEVLVARLTAPAWTPLFGRAAAVVTDGGTLAAHASLVVREYGIPAVVGTSEATRRLHNGQVVIVDGGAGVVQLNR